MRFLSVLLIFLSALSAGAMTSQQRSAAVENLRRGQADAAIRLLETSLRAGPSDAEAHQLLCRAYYQEERWDDAIEECSQAVALAPGDSNSHLWLGRAEGERADRVMFVTAYRLGRKVHAEFETAVQLSPSNVEALSDLGEFYVEAPPVVGGGVTKAQAIAVRLQSLDPARAYELRGRIAVEEKDPARAESYYRVAISASPHPASYWMVLASFYRKAEKWDKMQQALTSGIAADREHGVATVDAAHLLMRAGRDPQMSIRLLQSYLASPNQSESEPAFRVRNDLAVLLAAQGDSAGAQQQLAAAAALASGYHPAEAIKTHTGR
jgi:tetratricopeptide (TPR) repeat protein